MYSSNDWRDYQELYHHGIPGQKWGVQNGPPYPLNAKGKQRRMAELTNELNSKWEYGVLDNGKHIIDTEKYDWSKYRTTPVETLEKEKIGVCWDFVNYEHHIAKSLGLKDNAYLFTMQKSDRPDDIVTHTFLTYENGGKQYWVESAAWPKRGLHEINSYEDAVAELNDMYGNNGEKAYSVFKYNPEGLDKNLTDQEFFNRASRNLVLNHRGRNK